MKKIEKEEITEYKVNYCEVNYEYELVKEADYVKTRAYLIDDEHLMGEIVAIKKSLIMFHKNRT